MRRPLGMVALIAAVVMMGRIVLGSSPPEGQKWEKLFGEEEVVLTGRVYDVQERQSYGTTRLWIYLDSIVIQQYQASCVEADISDHMICQIADDKRPLIGSRIQVTGQFDTFSQARNPGQFDAARYYESLGICGMLKNGQILKTESGYCVLKEELYRLRSYWKEKLYNSLPEKEASILCAMLLGDKTGLDEEIKDLYQQNGIVHILSISGLHITLIGMSIYKLLRRLGCSVTISAVMGAVVLILYGMMTGMGISAVRAIGMYLLRMLGEILGRTYDMLTALGVMALGMLAVRPTFLYNGGFLLSFGSICGIGLLLPVLVGSGKTATARNQNGKATAGIAVCKDGRIATYKNRWQKLWEKILESVKNALYPGLAVTLFTLPIQLSMFYQMPVYSLVLNMLVLPFMGVVMSAGILCLLLPGGGKIGMISVWILQGYEGLCKVFGGLPGHTWNPGAPEIWQIVLYYVLIALCILLHRLGKVRFLRLVLVGAVLLMGIHLPEGFSVTFLDVGQGDCICIRTGKETYLFDCGSSSDRNAGENILIPYLQHEGIECLDGIFISHPDSDHINGVIQLLTSEDAAYIEVERLILPDIAVTRRQEELGELLSAAQEARENPIPVSFMGQGATWQSGQVSFTCLSPEPGEAQLDSNAYSQCFLVEYGTFSLLLTGDVEGEGEERMTEALLEWRSVGAVTLLKVAHHGSRYSTSEEFLQAVHPAAAIISCAEDNSYGHPHEELLERLENVGSRIYQTARAGAIEVCVRGEEVCIRSFVSSSP